MGRLFSLCIFTGCFFVVPFSTWANVGAKAAFVDQFDHETIQIIVTTKTITVDAHFDGRDLYIAGVLENIDPLHSQQSRYDVVVSLEGPARTMVMREKKRNAGVWVNTDSLTFKNVPLFYSMVTTREIDEITSVEDYKRLGLGLSYLLLQTDEQDLGKVQIFRDELIKLQKTKNLYHEEVGGVRFGSGALFTAHFRLPANTPVGHYQVRAYLFRDGQFIDRATTTLEIVKAHIAYTIFHAAHKYSFLYGVVAVIVAVSTGFLCRLIFQKD
ncbi:TIGR02186 family protein [Bartonella vinsonii]|uniref:Transmembrane protein (Alph_Pro_TM) n=1 Tax=Bartonella vinsonii TaxID=33047 RepID=A0A3S4YVQ9_BARVI|nr:TIGR02186 family protein [Bartonella vinsonii]VEJ45730.1 Putative transmembrane protein (Alph_Pro_TM) [Bartonella vinsonii]